MAARAIRRAGELFKQVEPNKSGRPSETRGSYSRKQAMADAGLSSDQGKQAIRVANVPEADFERQGEVAMPAHLLSMRRARAAMSRSRRKTHIVGITTAESDKAFKQAEHRRERRAVKSVMKAGEEPPAAKAFGNPWASEKDGKHWIDDMPEKLRRK